MDLFTKHCQRHNGPEGWVHITSSNTNLDQVSEFWPSINFKISTKHQPLHKTITSKSWQNLASESRLRFNLIQHNLYKTSAEKKWLNSSFTSCVDFEICKKMLPTWSSSATVTVLSWNLHTPGLHQSSLLNRSQLVSQLVSDKGKQWSDSGPIKIFLALSWIFWPMAQHKIHILWHEINSFGAKFSIINIKATNI